MAGCSTQRHHLSPLTLPHLSLSFSLVLVLILIIEGRRVKGKGFAFEEDEVTSVGVQCGVLYQPHSP